MPVGKNYIEVNKKAWNSSTPFHVRSAFYRQDQFLNGESSLKEIELDLIGDVLGKEILHLQCHFGQDTLSLQRLGAVVTGVDFSETAIEIAKSSAKKLSLPTDFLCTDIYHLPNVLRKNFDMLFTTYGVLGWLPDMKAWARIVHDMLKPGGKLLLVEFHPFIWTMDSQCKEIAYNYFNDGPIIEVNKGTYADRLAPIENETISWNHGLSEVIRPLLDLGFHIETFNEYDYSPYACFENMHEEEPSKFRFGHLKYRIPMVYALCAVKPGKQG